MSALEETLAQGTRLHQSGKLAEAERAYRQVLAANPRHPHALHQMGMLALQSRQFDMALGLISEAIQADSSVSIFHANLGEAYRHAGRPQQAIESYRRALQLSPELAPVYMLLGRLLHQQGQLQEAEPPLREALRLQPQDVQARTHLGLVLDSQCKFDEAEACFRQVIHSDDSAEAHYNLGNVLQSQHRHEEAFAEYQATLTREPMHVAAHNNLGTLYKMQGNFPAADQHFRAAISRNAGFAPAQINLGVSLQMQERWNDAASAYRAALVLEPNSTIALHGLGTVLSHHGRLDEARQCFEKALTVDPGHANAHLSLGLLYQYEGDAERAMHHSLEALRSNPNSPEGHNNLSASWMRLGRHDQAIASARRAIELRPTFGAAHGNLAVALQAVGLQSEGIAAHRQSVAHKPTDSYLHSNLLYALNYDPAYSPQAIFEEHLAWAQVHADPLTASSAAHGNEASPTQRLRVGYVSPHFCEHAVNFFCEPILASHDKEQFEIHCFSDVDMMDAATERLRGYADRWHAIRSLGDEAAARLIREAQIDILVDLTGHISGGKRMRLFARKPAPIQVTYLGYQATTGMRAMDYRLTDAHSDPPDRTDALHSERLERLPRSFFCYQPSSDAPQCTSLPATQSGYVTLGSVNAFTKVTPAVLATWADILERVPDSRLLIRAELTESLKARLVETFATRGIERRRLELVNRLPRAEYLELISRLDIGLDPFPFNGHTTTCDCLWQGVPVVSLAGESYVQRFGSSALLTLGLAELIAHSREEYVEIAVALASDRQRLESYRATLRERMAASPLLDFTGFTRNLEASYRRLWTEWCESR